MKKEPTNANVNGAKMHKGMTKKHSTLKKALEI